MPTDAIQTCQLALTSALAPERAYERFPLEQKKRDVKYDSALVFQSAEIHLARPRTYMWVTD